MSKSGFLLVLLLAEALAEEHPNSIFKPVGGKLELGFCFGADYMLLYKQTVEGKQLLGNSSNIAAVSPEAYRGRISPTNLLGQLLGMQLEKLTVPDSGVYLLECWRNNKFVSHTEQYLNVCDKEVSSEQILLEPDGGANLVCRTNYSWWESATIRWFTEAEYKTSLFLDTKMSLKPLPEELKGVLQVRDKGSSLHISREGLKDNRQFYCLIMEGQQCRSFQNLHLSDNDDVDVQSVYYSVKETAVLSCFSEHLNEIYWTTPFGRVNSTSPSTSEMYISKSEEVGVYSLVIPIITLNHSGEYKCSTNSAEYFMTVCSELVSDEIQVYEGDKVTLGCTSPTDDLVNIQWYRQIGLEDDQLIYDSGDPSLNMSANMNIVDSALTITELTEEDSGEYRCVVLLDDMGNYPDDSFVDIPEGEAENSEETDDDSNWMGEEESTDKCLLKQVIQLKIRSKTNRFTTKTPRNANGQVTSGSVPESEVESKSVPESKSKPDTESGTPQYAMIGGGVVTVLLIALIVGVVVMKLRAKRKAANQSRVDASAQQKETPVSQPLLHLTSKP